VFHWPERWNVSRHATVRWIERVGRTSNTWAARRLIQAATDSSILVPNRLATQLWVHQVVNDDFTTLKRRQGFRYRMTSQAVLIMSGQTIVTVLKTTAEDLATVLVWQITGTWLGDEQVWEEPLVRKGA
jgi:hypothetical protein